MVCVLAKGGKLLMPTNIKRARQLLKKGRAKIAGHHPFTIQLLDREDGGTQPVEYKRDTGDYHIGISICTEKRELVSAQYDLLPDEPERHRDRVVNRRNRRGRKRYRKPRFDNRKKPEGWLPPTLRNKCDQHVQLYQRYAKVPPITDVRMEIRRCLQRRRRGVQCRKAQTISTARAMDMIPFVKQCSHGTDILVRPAEGVCRTEPYFACIIWDSVCRTTRTAWTIC